MGHPAALIAFLHQPRPKLNIWDDWCRFSQARCPSCHQANGIKPQTRMWANAQRDGHPAEYKWRPLFNAEKFG